ncbi:hypothetical protein DMUE_1837 [Dictyocoela muelleri]|nr:hypothetical protein DMUE_1837 [Dictyocoela muelleri]
MYCVFRRKWHSGIFLKNAVEDQIKCLKSKYPLIANRNNDSEFLKWILEIRAFYIVKFLKFLNLKKPFLVAYLILSYKSYILRTQGSLNLINEKRDFKKMFKMNIINLINILKNQFINDNKDSYENFVI